MARGPQKETCSKNAEAKESGVYTSSVRMLDASTVTERIYKGEQKRARTHIGLGHALYLILAIFIPSAGRVPEGTPVAG